MRLTRAPCILNITVHCNAVESGHIYTQFTGPIPEPINAKVRKNPTQAGRRRIAMEPVIVEDGIRRSRRRRRMIISEFS